MQQREQTEPELVWGGPPACQFVRKVTHENLGLEKFYARYARGIYGDAIQKVGGHLVLNTEKFRKRFWLDPQGA